MITTTAPKFKMLGHKLRRISKTIVDSNNQQAVEQGIIIRIIVSAKIRQMVGVILQTIRETFLNKEWV